MKGHKERAHSKFSASGAERWFNCSASVEASEGMPDKPNEWSIEGTKAHELLEEIMLVMIRNGLTKVFYPQVSKAIPPEMVVHATNAANFILGIGAKNKAEVLVETRVYLDFIDPDMFGTFDGAVLDHFGTLHVFDFKYGQGHSVRAEENLQMIFYGLGLAHKYQWNFKRVRLWIIQPRIKGYDGPTYWDLSIDELRGYIPKFRAAVKRVKTNPTFAEGAWCYWCKAKSTCPLKTKIRRESAVDIFKTNPIKKERKNNGKEKSKEEIKRLAKKGWRKAEEETEKDRDLEVW